MRKLLVMDWNGVMARDGFKGFEVRHVSGMVSGVDMMWSDGVVMWNEVIDPCEKVGMEMRMMRKPVVVMQHGVQGHETEYERWMRWPRADMMFVWDERSREMYEAAGFKAERLVICGSPVVRHFGSWKPDGEMVIFVPVHAEMEESRNRENGLEAGKIWEILRGMSGATPYMKLLDGEHEDGGRLRGNKIVTDRSNGDEHLRVISWYLSKASCVVVQDDGTFSGMALTMGVPVLKVRNKYPLNNVAVKEVSLEDLGREIEWSLRNPWDGVERRREAGLKPFEPKIFNDRLHGVFERDKVVA